MSEQQFDLALRPPPLPQARRADPVTSHQAAASMREGAAIHRGKILVALRVLGARGGTYREVATQAQLEPVAVGRRLKELVRMGLVVRLLETRPTPRASGHVYRRAL
jgi:DNA-binding IclR family transcriptional regulator